jgi:GTPase
MMDTLTLFNKKPLPRIVLVGRPNVGKSTLFNRLAERRIALVDDTPGMTRDYKEALATFADHQFQLLDTAGFEDVYDESLTSRMRLQTEKAIQQADLILFLIDTRAGLTPLDRYFASWLRKTKKPVLMVANKSEGRQGETGYLEAFSLGLGEPLPISAEHGEGIVTLWQTIFKHFPELSLDKPDKNLWEDETPEQEDIEHKERTVQLAIVGRPNVGKSTLLNAILGEERVLTGPEAGITRDSIAVDLNYEGKSLKLIDTAGLRKRRNIDASIEKLANFDTFKSIQYADIVVLVCDATQPLENQDLTIARKVLEEGRALIIALNKWDLIQNPDKALKEVHEILEDSLSQAKGITVVPLSAIKQKNYHGLFKEVFKVYGLWNKRIPTSELNRWLEHMIFKNPPPTVQGKRLKIKYVTQSKSRPPTFIVFMTRALELPEAYVRYLKTGLRESFDLWGVPLRFFVRGSKNPYV